MKATTLDLNSADLTALMQRVSAHIKRERYRAESYIIAEDERAIHWMHVDTFKTPKVLQLRVTPKAKLTMVCMPDDYKRGYLLETLCMEGYLADTTEDSVFIRTEASAEAIQEIVRKNVRLQ